MKRSKFVTHLIYVKLLKNHENEKSVCEWGGGGWGGCGGRGDDIEISVRESQKIAIIVIIPFLKEQ